MPSSFIYMIPMFLWNFFWDITKMVPFSLWFRDVLGTINQISSSHDKSLKIHRLTTPGLWSNIAQAGRHCRFLLDRVTSLGKLWCQSQWDRGKLTSNYYFEGKSFVVHNGGFEDYTRENKSMPCDALNLLMPDFSGTMLSECCFGKFIVPSLSLWN